MAIPAVVSQEILNGEIVNLEIAKFRGPFERELMKLAIATEKI